MCVCVCMGVYALGSEVNRSQREASADAAKYRDVMKRRVTSICN